MGQKYGALITFAFAVLEWLKLHHEQHNKYVSYIYIYRNNKKINIIYLCVRLCVCDEKRGFLVQIVNELRYVT